MDNFSFNVVGDGTLEISRSTTPNSQGGIEWLLSIVRCAEMNGFNFKGDQINPNPVCFHRPDDGPRNPGLEGETWYYDGDLESFSQQLLAEGKVVLKGPRWSSTPYAPPSGLYP